MIRTARIIFLMAGCIFPIFIGALHTITHFSQLMTPELHQFLQKEVVIFEEAQPIWNTWGIVSFMMGASMVIIGLLNISAFRKLSKTEYPPIISLGAMIIFQFCVIYVGYEFEQSFQFYGGIFGGLLFLVSLILTLRNKNLTL